MTILLPFTLATLLAGCSEYGVTTVERRDSFAQRATNEVDLLVVVDNSCSMVEEHAHLADNFGSMIALFDEAEVDWRVAVTTTDALTTGRRGRLEGRNDALILTAADGDLLDEVAWDADWTFSPDVAWQLDPGSLHPDENDAVEAWCTADQVFDGGLGSPGDLNPACAGGSEAPAITGADGGPRAPTPGDLVLSELMALTSVGDPSCEWFEITSLTADTLDLGGVSVSDEGSDFATLPDDLLLPPGEALVIGRDPDALEVCGVPVDADVGDGVRFADGTVILSAALPDVVERFGGLVEVGTGSAGLEMGLEAARLTLSEPYYSRDNDAFLRDEASFSVLFVSDEDDVSPDPVDDYVYDLLSRKGTEGFRVPGRVNLAAITGVEEPAAPGEPSCSGESGEAAWGERYLQALERTDGPARSICEDFYEVVNDLGLTLSGLERDFALSDWPRMETLSVTLYEDGTEEGLAGELTMDEDYTPYLFYPAEDDPVVHLIFEADSLPPPGSAIVATYIIASSADSVEEWFAERGQ